MTVCEYNVGGTCTCLDRLVTGRLDDKGLCSVGNLEEYIDTKLHLCNHLVTDINIQQRSEVTNVKMPQVYSLQ